MSDSAPIPRPEYPRPQWVRPDWLCLNGQWQFEIDPGDSGLDRGLLERDLKDKILVPFCPESKLSGIGHTDFMDAVWYRREVTIPATWGDRHIRLHFQAVDHDATVWVNGREVVRHRGGFTPFTADLSHHGVRGGETITLVVRARDDKRAPQPRGKQCEVYPSRRCLYTRTTGIWQTVWMEPVPRTSLKRARVTPDLANGSFHVEQPIDGAFAGLRLRVTLSDPQGVLVTRTVPADLDFAPQVELPIPETRRRLWEPGRGELYDLELELLDPAENVIDRVRSYAGLRGIAIEGKAIKINGRPIFQRLVLDQGYYPDGIMTAPSDEALQNDIALSMAAGFNGARLHQKVFEERFLYHADRMGYLCWGEFPDWGARFGLGTRSAHEGLSMTYLPQWQETLERDYSHPCIVGWCGLNETHRLIEDDLRMRDDRITHLDDVTRAMFLAAKSFDKTRPVLDVSGYSHRVEETDVYDCHGYWQDPEEMKRELDGRAEERPWQNAKSVSKHQVPYRGQPFFNSEFGGIWWQPGVEPDDRSWGYGQRPKDLEEFHDRFGKLCAVLLDHPAMFGYCYTQLTDVEQEQNGIYFYDRRPKFDLDRIRTAQQRPAAIEKMAK